MADDVTDDLATQQAGPNVDPAAVVSQLRPWSGEFVEGVDVSELVLVPLDVEPGLGEQSLRLR